MKFHSLRVSGLERPTEEAVAVSFEVPNALKEEFRFLQGQHLTLRKEIEGEDVRRSYSICSCPLDDELTVAIKRVDGGKFSNFANDHLKVGDELDILPPAGKFNTPLDANQEKDYVAFAGGSGITPIVSIIETTLRTEPNSKFQLFYANRRTSSIIFHERLEALKNKYMGRFSLYHVLSEERIDPELYHGRIDAEKLTTFSRLFFQPAQIDDFFTCGPEPMMLTIRDTLLELGVPSEKIHLELFTSPVGKLGQDNKAAAPAKKAKSDITIVLDGHSHEIAYDSNESILDVAFQHGLDLPFACKGGVCSTCVCKVEKGKVEMKINYALEPDELERGLVLSCQSVPVTEKVKLTFDV